GHGLQKGRFDAEGVVSRQRLARNLEENASIRRRHRQTPLLKCSGVANPATPGRTYGKSASERRHHASRNDYGRVLRSIPVKSRPRQESGGRAQRAHPELEGRLLYAGRGSHFGGEVALGLLDAFAERIAHEPGQGDRRADILFSILDRIADLGLAIDHEGLRQQRDFFEVLAHAAIDHLLGDVVRLAGFLDLLEDDRTLAGNDFLIQFLRGNGLRLGGSNVHCKLLAEGAEGGLVTGRFQSDENADLAEAWLYRVVDVAFHDAIGDRHGLGTAQVHVLADLGDGFRQFSRDRMARAGERHFAQL